MVLNHHLTTKQYGLKGKEKGCWWRWGSKQMFLDYVKSKCAFFIVNTVYKEANIAQMQAKKQVFVHCKHINEVQYMSAWMRFCLPPQSPKTTVFQITWKLYGDGEQDKYLNMLMAEIHRVIPRKSPFYHHVLASNLKLLKTGGENLLTDFHNHFYRKPHSI